MRSSSCQDTSARTQPAGSEVEDEVLATPVEAAPTTLVSEAALMALKQYSQAERAKCQKSESADSERVLL